MDKLGLYLLVSLFFVVSTMIEFAIVLLVKRHSESRVSTKGHDTQYERKVGYEKGRNPKRNMSKSDGIKGNTTIQESSFNLNLVRLPLVDAFFDSGERFKHTDNLDDIQQDNSFKCFKLSSNAIDIAASLLFPTLYGIFNIIYWCYLM